MENYSTCCRSASPKMIVHKEEKVAFAWSSGDSFKSRRTIQAVDGVALVTYCHCHVRFPSKKLWWYPPQRKRVDPDGIISDARDIRAQEWSYYIDHYSRVGPNEPSLAGSGIEVRVLTKSYLLVSNTTFWHWNAEKKKTWQYLVEKLVISEIAYGQFRYFTINDHVPPKGPNQPSS